MDHNCPICNNKLQREHKIKHVDYHCYPPKKDHHYAERWMQDNKVAIKVRVSPEGPKIFFSQDFDKQSMEVWCEPETPKQERIQVSSLFEPDFSDLKGLFHKLKTYLIFS